MRVLISIAALLLTACAAVEPPETATLEVPAWPNEMWKDEVIDKGVEVKIHTLTDEEMRDLYDEIYVIHPENPFVGVSVSDEDKTFCNVYVLAPDFSEGIQHEWLYVLGHEVAHCFIYNLHWSKYECRLLGSDC